MSKMGAVDFRNTDTRFENNRLRRKFAGDSIEDLASIRTRRFASTIRSTREGKTLGGERKTFREGKTPIRERKTPISLFPATRGLVCNQGAGLFSLMGTTLEAMLPTYTKCV